MFLLSTPKLATWRLLLLLFFLFFLQLLRLMGGIKLHRYRVPRGGEESASVKLHAFRHRQSYPWGVWSLSLRMLWIFFFQRVHDVKYRAWDEVAHLY